MLSSLDDQRTASHARDYVPVVSAWKDVENDCEGGKRGNFDDGKRSARTDPCTRICLANDNETQRTRHADRRARRERLRPTVSNRLNESVVASGGRESIDGIMHRAA